MILQRDKLIDHYRKAKAKSESFSVSEQNEKEKETLQNTLNKKKDSINKIIQELHSTENTKTGKINDVFITFKNSKYSKFLFNTYNKTKCTRCCMIFCCKYSSIKKLYYKKTLMNIQKNPDNPSNIKWQNMVISPSKKCLWKFLAIALSTFLILISFGIIVTGKYFEDLLNEGFNSNLNCDYLEYSMDSVQQEYFDKKLGKKSRIKTYCFCKAISCRAWNHARVRLRFP